MQRILQLINEAIEEIEKYGSCESAYYLLKYISSHGEELVKENETKYDFTIDNLIFLSVQNEIPKYKLFALSFFIYDYLSKKYKVQDPLFIFRWSKMYFIYSYRIEAHLLNLMKNQFLVTKRGKIKLTPKGESESENSYTLLSSQDKENIEKIREEIEKRKLTELRVFTKKYLFSK